MGVNVCHTHNGFGINDDIFTSNVLLMFGKAHLKNNRVIIIYTVSMTSCMVSMTSSDVSMTSYMVSMTSSNVSMTSCMVSMVLFRQSSWSLARIHMAQSCPRVGWTRGSGRVGSGRVGSGRVGSGRVGSGRVTILLDFGGSGRVGSALRIY